MTREDPVIGNAAIYEYLKKLRGQTFGLTVSVLHGTEKVAIVEAKDAVTTTGVNWIVEPSHLLFNNAASETLIPLENVVAVTRSIADEVLELIVRYPTADT